MSFLSIKIDNNHEFEIIEILNLSWYQNKFKYFVHWCRFDILWMYIRTKILPNTTKKVNSFHQKHLSKPRWKVLKYFFVKKIIFSKYCILFFIFVCSFYVIVVLKRWRTKNKTMQLKSYHFLNYKKIHQDYHILQDDTIEIKIVNNNMFLLK